MHASRIVKTHDGFTIVELLIVIVVIAILAAITVVAYNGIQTRADTAARQVEALNWKKSFIAYKSAYGSFPSVPDGGYCLGTGSPNGHCRDYLYPGSYQYAEADSVGLMNELKKVATVSSGTRKPINNTIGPYVLYFPTNIVIQQIFRGGAGDCPSSLNYAYTENDMVICDTDMVR